MGQLPTSPLSSLKTTSTNLNSFFEYFLLFPFTIKDSLSTTPQDIFHLFLFFHSELKAGKQNDINTNKKYHLMNLRNFDLKS